MPRPASVRSRCATSAPIRANPRRLILKEFSSWLLGEVRDDFDMVFLFGNQAMAAGVDTHTALYCDRDNPRYAEYLVTRRDNRDARAVRALAAALNSEPTRDFIASAYSGQLATAF